MVGGSNFLVTMKRYLCANKVYNPTGLLLDQNASSLATPLSGSGRLPKHLERRHRLPPPPPSLMGRPMKTDGASDVGMHARARAGGRDPSIHQTNNATIWSANFGGSMFQIALSISLTGRITVSRLITDDGNFRWRC